LIDIITWVFEEGSFVPCARITDRGSQSIVTDYLGTPTQMYDTNGEKTWEAVLDIYGRVRTFAGRSLSDCPFRYQGQYQDEETGLYYNRFRYYDAEVGSYISQDPIGGR
jgi:RHS repeat-associated protein